MVHNNIIVIIIIKNNTKIMTKWTVSQYLLCRLFGMQTLKNSWTWADKWHCKFSYLQRHFLSKSEWFDKKISMHEIVNKIVKENVKPVFFMRDLAYAYTGR